MIEYVRDADSYMSSCVIQITKDINQMMTTAFIRTGTPIPGIIGPPRLLIFEETASGLDKVDGEDNIYNDVE